jgi:glucose/arabinose dehydrogenase
VTVLPTPGGSIEHKIEPIHLARLLLRGTGLHKSNTCNDLAEAPSISPDYALGSHTASLGLVFYKASLFPASYRGGAFIGQHGSWNRAVFNGYKVIFIPFKEGSPSGKPQDVLTEFIDEQGHAQGRPSA